MKKHNGYMCRVYGNEYTQLILSDKAEEYYRNTDPLSIYEREEDRDDETVCLYSVGGLYESDGWMTEDELNQYLEGLADELTAEYLEIADAYHWTPESWGSEYPPENADEIIEQANRMIDEYAVKHPAEWLIEGYAEDLWERFCTTGKLDI